MLASANKGSYPRVIFLQGAKRAACRTPRRGRLTAFAPLILKAASFRCRDRIFRRECPRSSPIRATDI